MSDKDMKHKSEENHEEREDSRFVGKRGDFSILTEEEYKARVEKENAEMEATRQEMLKRSAERRAKKSQENNQEKTSDSPKHDQ